VSEVLPDPVCVRFLFLQARRRRPCPSATGRLWCSAGCPRWGRGCSPEGRELSEWRRKSFPSVQVEFRSWISSGNVAAQPLRKLIYRKTILLKVCINKTL
jgi:hypothetical protein